MAGTRAVGGCACLVKRGGARKAAARRGQAAGEVE